MRGILTLGGVFIWFLVPGLASAQSVSVAVVSAERREPLAPVAVVVLDQQGRVVVPAQVTDSIGQRTIQLPGPGKFVVQARKLGYESQTTKEFSVGTGETKRLEIALKPIAQDLARVDIKAMATFEERAFASRQRTNNGGRLFTKRDLDSLDIRHLAEAVNLTMGASAKLSRRGLWQFTTRQRELAISMGRGPCKVNYYWNGLKLNSDDEWSFDFLATIDPKNVTALEVYPREAGVPAEFSFGAPCAAVVVWTKPGVSKP